MIYYKNDPHSYAKSLNEFINESLVMFKEKAFKHSINVTSSIDGNIENIFADKKRLKQVVINLLSNAFKFTDDGGAVGIAVRRVKGLESSCGDFIEISVADTGPGIREEDIPRLFRPFEQLDQSITKKYEGTGLGLALSKKIIGLHGGRIWVESKVGEGSRFIFIIPDKTVNGG